MVHDCLNKVSPSNNIGLTRCEYSTYLPDLGQVTAATDVKVNECSLNARSHVLLWGHYVFRVFGGWTVYFQLSAEGRVVST